MDGWINGWMDGWMTGWMDGWPDGWMDVSKLDSDSNMKLLKIVIVIYLQMYNNNIWANYSIKQVRMNYSSV